MSDEKCIPTGNILMDTLFKMQKSWVRAHNRKETIKRLFI